LRKLLRKFKFEDLRRLQMDLPMLMKAFPELVENRQPQDEEWYYCEYPEANSGTDPFRRDNMVI
jgi:hypothetical protein